MKRQKLRKGLIIVSFLILPITLYYFSPILIIQGAFEGVAVGSVIVFALMALFSLFFGRAFCGWVCPLGGMQDCLALASDKKARGKRRNWIKYFIFVPWLAFIVVGAVVAKGIKKVDFFYMTNHGISISDIHSLIIYFVVITVVTVMALVAGKRSFCHYACWMAPFMIIGTKIKDGLKIPSLHLTASTEKCSNCKLCSKQCPMSLEVDAMVNRNNMKNSECILCGQCVDSCPRKAIQFSFKG
jgi:ferredoxin-type protein NapH